MLILLTLMTLASAQDRFPPEVERALSALDRDGFSAGKCWAYLPTETQEAISAGQARYDASQATPRPVLDQVFYGAVRRGKTDALRNPHDREACADFRESAAEVMAEQAEALKAFEASLAPALRRSSAP
ncbi:hypothetical protein [uncultured Brevundimonas sp.]|uniref:hypothetical protein n=1 Tax=uncultured Brevundimonas sp. TaxID=213418 RepID=UPI0025EB79E7|nr:hypothetical protein [uncultured Brevundimonas sp.]